MVKVGVLALQGDFAEHMEVLHAMGVEALEVRLPHDLRNVDALIIPGGESTTIARLMESFGLAQEIKSVVRAGMPTWGTCAGMIVLAREIAEDRPETLGLIDIQVRRNAFGRQVDSFEADIAVPSLGREPFRAIFIRAPVIERIGPGVKPLAYLSDHQVVAAQEGHVLVTAFHPELTHDQRFHSYFLRIPVGS